MTADIKKRGLGRGLDALFKDARSEEEAFAPKVRRADEIIAPPGPAAAAAAGARKIAIEKIKPGKFQPRRRFDDAALDALAQSVAAHGVVQPLLLRPLTSDTYEIIAGERRWRAAQKAKLHELPAVILTLNDTEALEIGLIENLQREDLSPMEEAEGYQRLIGEFHHTQDEVAQRLGKSRSHVANMLRLLKLPPKTRRYVQEGKLSAGHARALVGVAQADEFADIIIKRALSVRQTEKLVQKIAQPVAKKSHPAHRTLVLKDVDVLAAEEKISSLLGMKVTIEGAGPSGVLQVEYKSLDQLDDLLARLSFAPKK